MSKQKAKKVLDKIKGEAKKVGGKIVQVAEDAPFVVLFPFKGMMEHQLDAKGIKHTGKLHDVAVKFGESIVGLKSIKNFSDAREVGGGSNYSGYGVASLYRNFEEREYHLAPELIEGLIDGIVGYIKGLKAKKASGQKLTPQEEKALADANKAAEVALKSGKDTVGIGLSNFLFSWKGGVALLVVIALLWVLIAD